MSMWPELFDIIWRATTIGDIRRVCAILCNGDDSFGVDEIEEWLLYWRERIELDDEDRLKEVRHFESCRAHFG